MTFRIDRWRWSGLVLLLVVCLPAGLEAKVERVEILSRSDVLAGRPFGLGGPYEKVVGRVHFLVDPFQPANRRVVDLIEQGGAPCGEESLSGRALIGLA